MKFIYKSSFDKANRTSLSGKRGIGLENALPVFAEIKEKLIPAEPGMYKLKDEISRLCDQEVPKSCRRKVRFMLVSEISNIYKKNNLNA